MSAYACTGEPDAVAGTGNLGPAADAGVDSAVPPPTPDANVLIPLDDSGAVYNPGGGDGGCGAVLAKTVPEKPKVDVVWVLDGSGSMGPYAAAIGGNMLSFMDSIRSSGADVSVVMVTGFEFGLVLQAGIPDPNYHWVNQGVDSHNAFRALLTAYPNYAQFLRPGAPTHFVVVTDDSSNMSAAEFLPAMQSNLGHDFFFHSVSAGPAYPGCGGSGDGFEYTNVSDTTGGEKISLCSDWSVVNEKLKGNVVASAPLPCHYPIPAPPNGEALERGAVQVVYTPVGGMTNEFPKADSAEMCGTNLAWHYDAADTTAQPTRVVLCPSACDAAKAGGDISLAFGCAPTILR